MKNIIFGTCFVALLLLMTGCAKDMDDELSFHGTWIETAPVEGRTELLIMPDGILYLSKSGTSEKFEYRVENEMLYLKPAGEGGEFPETGLLFEQIDANTLKMGDVYPRIPENEPVIIVLERK